MSRRYFAPATVREATDLLAEHPTAGVVAGGTDLVVAARTGKQPLPEVLIAIHQTAGLAGTRCTGDGGLRLAALTTHDWIEHAGPVGSRWSALADASALIGSPATRRHGTLGGNLMNASPAMDTGAPLLVLGAVVELDSVRGARRMRVDELLDSPGRTAAARDELLTAVELPAPPPRGGSAYVRIEYRLAMEIAVVGAAAHVCLDHDGRVSEARIALAAVAPRCVRVPGIEGALIGRRPDAAAARAAAGDLTGVRPISDVRASARYRRAVAVTAVARAVVVAARRAGGEAIAVPANRTLARSAGSRP